MWTVTRIVEVGVAILVTVIAFRPSNPFGVSKTSTVIGTMGFGVAIFAAILAFRPSEPCQQ